MKKLLLSLLIAPVLGFGQTNFCSGWDKGYQDGLNSCMKAGVSPICPIPPVGSDSYNDGYGLAYSKAKKNVIRTFQIIRDRYPQLFQN